MNKVILIGRLCNDVELRHTTNDTAVAVYRLAVDRPFKKDGQAETDFLNCVAYSNNAEFAERFLRKGMKIAIEGRIQTRNYVDNDGKKVYITEIIVDRHEFCERKSDNNDDANYHKTDFAVAEPQSFNQGVFAADSFEEIGTDGDLPFN